MTNTNIETFLAAQSGFRRFTPSDRATLARALSVQDFVDGHVFTHQGHPGDSLYLVVAGRIRVTRDIEIAGEPQEFDALGPGDLFGLLSLIDRMPAAATCVADGPVRVAVLPRTAFNLLVHSAAPIAVHFQRSVANQVARDLQARNRALRGLLGTERRST